MVVRARNTSHAADERLRQIDRELSASDLKEKEKALLHYLKENPEDIPKILMMCQSGMIKKMQRREIDKNIPDSSTHYRVLASRTKETAAHRHLEGQHRRHDPQAARADDEGHHPAALLLRIRLGGEGVAYIYICIHIYIQIKVYVLCVCIYIYIYIYTYV